MEAWGSDLGNFFPEIREAIMGRKPWSNRRVVEDCRALSIATLVRRGLFSGGMTSSGYRHAFPTQMVWTSGFSACVTSPGRLLDTPSPCNDEVKLTYDVGRYDIEERIEIVSRPSPLRRAGLRYHFLCPGWDDAPCQKRVGKLYLPPGEDYFRCRACHDLTYRSAKQHDKRVDALRRSPAELTEALHGPNRSSASLALRVACELLQGRK